MTGLQFFIAALVLYVVVQIIAAILPRKRKTTRRTPQNTPQARVQPTKLTRHTYHISLKPNSDAKDVMATLLNCQHIRSAKILGTNTTWNTTVIAVVTDNPKQFAALTEALEIILYSELVAFTV